MEAQSILDVLGKDECMTVKTKSVLVSVTAQSTRRWWDSIFCSQNQTKLVHGCCRGSDKLELSPKERGPGGGVGV